MKTKLINQLITADERLYYNDVTFAKVIIDYDNTQNVYINGIQYKNNDIIVMPDGSSCDLVLEVVFKKGLIPSNNPISKIWLQYKKLL